MTAVALEAILAAVSEGPIMERPLDELLAEAERVHGRS